MVTVGKNKRFSLMFLWYVCFKICVAPFMMFNLESLKRQIHKWTKTTNILLFNVYFLNNFEYQINPKTFCSGWESYLRNLTCYRLSCFKSPAVGQQRVGSRWRLRQHSHVAGYHILTGTRRSTARVPLNDIENLEDDEVKEQHHLHQTELWQLWRTWVLWRTFKKYCCWVTQPHH